MAGTGDSIDVNGICSTVVRSGRELCFEYMEETLERTTADSWKIGDIANIEPSLALDGLVQGHLVQGHVDAVGRVSRIEKRPKSAVAWIAYDGKFGKYVASKGSVCVNGVSLTVVADEPGEFSFSLVRHTIENSNLGKLKKGDKVNLEFDIIAKYLEKLHG